ncbi:MAG: FHA domain-containing protein [Deltaproteobacteria bacterium]|nr:FHA domain-containing protein [Deltaproteobacteria bacterium]
MKRRVKTSETHPFHVDFLPRKAVNLDGRIGLASAPGRRELLAPDGPWQRDLDQDLTRLSQDYRINVLVTLLERGQYMADELVALGIPDLLVAAQRHDLETHWAPLPDANVPVPLEQLVTLVEQILTLVRDGRVVVLHCRDGLGRTGLVGAACLAALGASVNEALSVVRAVRPGALETAAQHQCLRAFDQLWRRRALERSVPADVSDLFDFQQSGDSTPGAPRPSQPGLAPMSHPGAATVQYLGLAPEAEAAGVGDGAPLRRGDLFHLMPGRVLLLGRSADCDITIASSQLSRVHALVAFVPASEGQLVVADLGSRNGTWVDDGRTEVTFLDLGQQFLLAKAYRFRFEAVG